jgi:flagellin-specific chaperone FliS
MDFNEIIKEYLRLYDEIVPKFCENIHDTLSAKHLSDYITKLTGRMKDELDNCLDNNGTLFNDLYSEAYDELCKSLDKNEITKIEDINNMIFNLTNDWYSSISSFLNVTKGESRSNHNLTRRD